MRPYVRPILLACAALWAATVPAALRAQGTLAEARLPARYAGAVDFARSLITAVMEGSGTPGMSVAVGIGGVIVWSEGLGYADVENRVPVWEETKFRIGSVSKPVTAAAVGLLMEQGTLDLDAPVQRYVPSFPEKRWPITTRQVAGHVAGIRHYRGDEFLSSRRYATVLDGLAMFETDTLLFEPGTRYSYSTYGWNLVSAVVEGASGEAFVPYMQEHVFDRLGMVHTAAEHTDSIIPHRARYYERTREGGVLNAPFVDNSYKWAGGGFISTPEDLVRFGFAHLRGDFLKPQTIAELWRPQATSDGRSTGYGIGWSVVVEDGRVTRASHGGGSIGGTTMFMVYPREQAVIAIVGNMTQAPTGGALPGLIMDAFLRPETLVPSEPGPDISGTYDCSVTASAGRVVTGRLELHGSPAEYWGRATWSNETQDRVLRSHSGRDATWLVIVDDRGGLSSLRFSTIARDRLAGQAYSGGTADVTCTRP